jgi:uncharacterized RDD family membrane protein YckC
MTTTFQLVKLGPWQIQLFIAFLRKSPVSQNPYASPSIAADSPTDDMKSKTGASQMKRFLNLIIDSVVLQGLGFVAGAALGALMAVSMVADHGSVTKDDEFQLQIVGAIAGLVINLLYYFFMELLFQRTLGKLVTGTMVISNDGGRPSMGQILGRSFARFIPFEWFSFFGGDPPRGWHDSLSGTRVVNVR